MITSRAKNVSYLRVTLRSLSEKLINNGNAVDVLANKYIFGFLRIHFSPRIVLSRAKNIFIAANIDSNVILQ